MPQERGGRRRRPVMEFSVGEQSAAQPSSAQASSQFATWLPWLWTSPAGRVRPLACLYLTEATLWLLLSLCFCFRFGFGFFIFYLKHFSFLKR